jgi:hypothetical protein
MSSLWYHETESGAWQAIEIAAGVTDLASPLGLPLRLAKLGVDGGLAEVALFVRGRPTARINGRRVMGGIRILRHRDELLVDGATLFYSDESLPLAQTFALHDGATRPRCPVCRRNIEDNETTVRCPRCSRVFHQLEGAEAKLCWTYRPFCLCMHPTDMNPDALWRPERELDP